ncbi:hypothetical protein GE061_018325 [Apolygus lucorum]|uniref:Uncharacterized protein n=1 Tax=Apolygus lucorum TaxID=248454 RepID=A0A6A4JHQ9_APOLU|nr:hypothetical protein GE061_018325 [Apolygus lucorum]
MQNGCWSYPKLDGLDEKRQKPKMFKKCNIWRDPDLDRNKKKERSFPNKMKRFLCELRGEDRLYLGPVVTPSIDKFRGISTVFTKYPSQQARDVSAKPAGRYPGTQKQKLKILTEGVCLADGDPGVVRCQNCDYPLEPQRRRRPPHVFAPIVVHSLETRSRMIEERSFSRASTVLFNRHGLKTPEILRIKRRHSSTELYKSVVAA